jgi:hypothetical protein
VESAERTFCRPWRFVSPRGPQRGPRRSRDRRRGWVRSGNRRGTWVGEGLGDRAGRRVWVRWRVGSRHRRSCRGPLPALVLSLRVRGERRTRPREGSGAGALPPFDGAPRGRPASLSRPGRAFETRSARRCACAVLSRHKGLRKLIVRPNRDRPADRPSWSRRRVPRTRPAQVARPMMSDRRYPSRG